MLAYSVWKSMTDVFAETEFLRQNKYLGNPYLVHQRFLAFQTVPWDQVILYFHEDLLIQVPQAVHRFLGHSSQEDLVFLLNLANLFLLRKVRDSVV